MRQTLVLLRDASRDEGTFGRLFGAGLESLHTLEPPWRDNLPDLSCIPPGEYLCVPHHSPHFGGVYLVTGVPGRSHILIHPGNYGGDESAGLRTHTHGCLLPGSWLGRLAGQRAVLASRAALGRLLAWLHGADLRLVIDTP